MGKTYVSIEVKGLLSTMGVTLETEFHHGSVEEALDELRSTHPDLQLVEEMLSPELTLSIPSVCNGKLVSVHLDRIHVPYLVGGKMLKRIAGYCELMKLDYKFGEES